MVLTEIIIDSFVLFAAIFLVIVTVSYVIYKLRRKKKRETSVNQTYVKLRDDGLKRTGQFTNVQFADNNNYNLNYYSYSDSFDNGNKIEINNTPPQYTSKHHSENAKFRRKSYHSHKSNSSIKKISYK